MEDDKWSDIDFRVKVTIILSLSNEVLYNMMNEKITADLWCRLESLYMMKSLSNKIFMNRQLYSIRMKEVTLILQHEKESSGYDDENHPDGKVQSISELH